MKCVMCNKGALQKKRVEYKEFDIVLGKYDANVCAKCGECFFESDVAKKIQVKSKELGLFGLSKKTKVAQVGNSLAIRVPKDIVNFTNLKKEKEVTISPQSPHKLIIDII